MTHAFHHKLPFDPSGNVYANSVTRTMKGQSLDVWDMFTRETLQNSWDARDRASTEDGVTFAIDYRDFDRGQAELLKQTVFGDDFDGIEELEQSLSTRSVNALFISDAGTHGLRGPSSAATAAGGPDDFASFVRNIGRSDSKTLAGGTYGFGKGVFFIVSQVNTILVYTRTVDEYGDRVNRFIAMANANDYVSNGIEYTGRHWWGVRAEGKTAGNITQYAEPFTGEEADTLASALGLDAHFTEDRPTGTAIAVLFPDLEDPDSGEFDVDGCLKAIASSLTRWAWPHMIDFGEQIDPIDFRVSRNNTEVPIPDPENDPAISQFIRAYQYALDVDGKSRNSWAEDFMGRRTQVWSQRPQKHLGNLAVINLPEAVSEAKTVIGKEISSQIATIRSPRMIVEYYNGPPNLSGRPYCGVFIAAEEADKVFARSEPAAHHEWNYQAIQHDAALLEEFWGTSRSNPVRILFNKMRELLSDSGQKKETEGSTLHFQALTSLSSELGGLIANTSGPDASVGTVAIPKLATKSTSSPKKKPSASVEVEDIKAVDGRIKVKFIVFVKAPKNHLPTTLRLFPVIVTDNGTLSIGDVADSGFDFPEFTDVSAAEDGIELNSGGTELQFAITEISTKFSVTVRQPPDCAISLDYRFYSTTQTEDSRGVER